MTAWSRYRHSITRLDDFGSVLSASRAARSPALAATTSASSRLRKAAWVGLEKSGGVGSWPFAAASSAAVAAAARTPTLAGLGAFPAAVAGLAGVLALAAAFGALAGLLAAG